MVTYWILFSLPLINLTDILNLKMKEQTFLTIFPLQIIFLFRKSDPHLDMSLGQRPGHLSQVD